MYDLLQPVTVTDTRPPFGDNCDSRYIRSYLMMRAAVGGLGILLPVLLILLDSVWLGHHPFWRDSLSAYYYSGARDLFVGILCATAVFLIAYKAFERNLDNLLATVAGVGAVLVAQFPTSRPGAGGLTPIQERLGETAVKTAHFTGAFVLIGSLGVLCYFFGLREGKRPKRPGQKMSPTFWRRYHWSCAGVIAAAILFVPVTSWGFHFEQSLLVGEIASVWAFGFSWLAKGLELDVLRGP